MAVATYITYITHVTNPWGRPKTVVLGGAKFIKLFILESACLPDSMIVGCAINAL